MALKQPVSVAAAERAPKKSKGRVLVMDDEEAVRQVARRILEFLGYSVAIAGDGKEALQAYRAALEAGQRFDAVIMDVTIPAGMGGEEAVKALRHADPTARAIVSSGYAEDRILVDYERYGFCGVVAKPYRVEDLAAALDVALAGVPSQAVGTHRHTERA